MKDGKYLVKGPDGQEREYVDSSKYVQKPAPPDTKGGGGKIENNSDRPILVLGNGEGHPENPHGDGFTGILQPGEKTDPYRTDYDGVVTDSPFQPVTLSDGSVLAPAKVDADAWQTLAEVRRELTEKEFEQVACKIAEQLLGLTWTNEDAKSAISLEHSV